MPATGAFFFNGAAVANTSMIVPFGSAKVSAFGMPGLGSSRVSQRTPSASSPRRSSLKSVSGATWNEMRAQRASPPFSSWTTRSPTRVAR